MHRNAGSSSSRSRRSMRSSRSTAQRDCEMRLRTLVQCAFEVVDDNTAHMHNHVLKCFGLRKASGRTSNKVWANDSGQRCCNQSIKMIQLLEKHTLSCELKALHSIQLCCGCLGLSTLSVSLSLSLFSLLLLLLRVAMIQLALLHHNMIVSSCNCTSADH